MDGYRFTIMREPEEWGVALHSLRSIGDVVGFCQVLMSFEKIKAKRKD